MCVGLAAACVSWSVGWRALATVVFALSLLGGGAGLVSFRARVFIGRLLWPLGVRVGLCSPDSKSPHQAPDSGSVEG